MSERVLVAAPLEPVETGQELEWLPLHMPILGWLAVRNSIDRGALGMAAYQSFQAGPVYQHVRSVDRILLSPRRDRAATLLAGVERVPWARLYGAANEVGMLPPDGSVTDHFIPHIPDLPFEVPYTGEDQVRAVSKGETLAFRQVAFFTQDSEKTDRYAVALTYELEEDSRV